jgi:hypothetical protein
MLLIYQEKKKKKKKRKKKERKKRKRMKTLHQTPLTLLTQRMNIQQSMPCEHLNQAGERKKGEKKKKQKIKKGFYNSFGASGITPLYTSVEPKTEQKNRSVSHIIVLTNS